MMKHALTIAACVLCASLDNVHAQQTVTYTTYVAGKATIVDQWTSTTEAAVNIKGELATVNTNIKSLTRLTPTS